MHALSLLRMKITTFIGSHSQPSQGKFSPRAQKGYVSG
jgi:hypothetical protein